MTARTYYEVLGVSRNCSAAELKKAYRKTSLKVHPDKNQAPEAVNAFQKVTDAYDTLSTPEKKELYDQVGHQRFSEHSRTGGAAGAGSHGFHGQPVSAEDLFNMFFSQAARGGGNGGGFNFGGAQMRPNRRGGRPRRPSPEEAQAAREAAARNQWFSVVPLLLVVLLWLGGTFFAETPAYSLERTASYPVRRGTQSTGEPLVYYVQRGFEQRYKTQREVFMVERDVWRETLKWLEQQCSLERRRKGEKMYWTFGARRAEIEKEPMPGCERFQRVYGDVPREERLG